MSLLLERPSTAAVQAVSKETILQRRERVAQFRGLLQEVFEVCARGASADTRLPMPWQIRPV